MRSLEWYSAVTGIPIDVLKKTVVEYEVESEVNVEEAVKSLCRAGLTIPSPSILEELDV